MKKIIDRREKGDQTVRGVQERRPMLALAIGEALAYDPPRSGRVSSAKTGQHAEHPNRLYAAPRLRDCTMRRIVFSTCCLGMLFGATILLPAHGDVQRAPAGFTPIFNGKDLTGWHGMPHFDPYKLAAMPATERSALIEKWTEDAKNHWRVENGELVNDGHGAYLTTDKEYGDIEFLIEYKTVPKADSGIYLRATPQVQIWDTTKEGGKWNIGADKGSGGLWNNTPGTPGRDPLVLADRPFGEWNSFRILQVGERTTVYLNDKLVVDHARLKNFWDHKKPLPRQGAIQLQTHGGEIRWRNLFIREIPAAEANAILAKKNRAGFKRIFNGKDFAGWSGAVENYQIVDGAIVCKPHKGGNLYTTEEYGDFMARLEFKLPPGGNNGLAIRYPGQGDPAYSGMCELQVLDDGAKMYAKLDPRQYHGSAYGMVPSHRGYQRAVGQWNFQEVTVKGSKITVELNGTVILDTDLSKVTEYMANSPHPGKTRTTGHFGFAGHNDPVAFRNVEIKKIP
jgi:3-keto-disaccharide hydrolase